jgi:acyl dehydratase
VIGARRLADVMAGDEIGPLPRLVTREAITAYAHASGDLNPLHRDDDIARTAGFPSVIAHGMFTMGHLATCVEEWAGDAASVVRLSVQFRAPVFPGETIVAGGRVRGLDDVSCEATLDVWVTVDREGTTEHPIRRGEAVVRLRP